MEEAPAVGQCGGLKVAPTHWDSLGKVGVEADWDVVPGNKRQQIND